MHPPSADHRRDDLHLAQLIGRDRDRVAVEHDEVGEPPGQEGAAAPLLAGEPGGRDGRGMERLLDRDRLVPAPRLSLVDRPAHPCCDPGEGIELLETTARGALGLLESLAPEQRDAIEARHLEERGYAEIAAELRCSESVVRKRVSRGLAALQAHLRDGEA